MGRHTSASPPPVFGDGKRRPIRARLQNITTAMTWIKEELVSEGEGREGRRVSGRGKRCERLSETGVPNNSRVYAILCVLTALCTHYTCGGG